MKTKLLLIICAQVFTMVSSSIKPILKNETRTNQSSRKVSFFSQKLEEQFVEAHNQDGKDHMVEKICKDNATKTCFACVKNIVQEDVVDCCIDNGQVGRFCLLGCVIFAQGYSCGVEHERSLTRPSNMQNYSKMK